MANIVNPDQMLHSGVVDLGQHCLQRPICPNTDNDQQGPVVQSIVSLMNELVSNQMLIVLVSTVSNSHIFLLKKCD